MSRTSSKSHSIPRAIWICATIAGLLAASPVFCRAQASKAPVASQAVKARTDLVRVDASVLDKHGNFAAGLARSDFRVLDDGAEQPIVFFAPVEAPARVLVMIETSPAVYLIHDQHVAAAYALLQGLDPADEVGLVTYSEAPRAILGFTTNKSAILDALNTLQYTIGRGDLHFYESVSGVVDGLDREPGKTAIVLLTTGLDASPVSDWQALVRKLRGTDVVIFSVALGGVLRGNESRRAKRTKGGLLSGPAEEGASTALDDVTGFARADRALELLAQISGGRTYFPQSDKDFAPMYREIASALRHQYVLGIEPKHDGKYHRLTVEVLSGNDRASEKQRSKSAYRIFAREGYIAPNE